MPVSVFMAHASEDKAAVLNLYERLTAYGFRAWLDKKNLVPGDNWRAVIADTIPNCDVFLACLTNSSAKAGFLLEEFKFALAEYAKRRDQRDGLDRSIVLIPVKLTACDIPDVSVANDNLRDFHWLDFWEEGGFEVLMRSIKTHIAFVELHEWLKQSGYRLRVSTREGEQVVSIMYRLSDGIEEHWSSAMLVTGPHSAKGFAGVGRDIHSALRDAVRQMEGGALKLQRGYWDDGYFVVDVPSPMVAGPEEAYAGLFQKDR